MKSIELKKSYDPKDFEDRIYRMWMDEHAFSPAEGSEKPFTIVMPPPNVTGILHMGHALNNLLQDILIRYWRMTGRPSLWVPGTDHAGIATQHVVERELAKEGLRRQDLGREKFLDRTWQVKERHHDTIVRQLQKIGSSCDWDRERFTLDEGLSRAVRESFVTLYERDLIYKGKYLVNYCTKCGTALADDEVEHREVPGKLYHVSYPWADGSGEITVATTRPETMFGDVAVAVNPEDERYQHLIGKELLLPLTDRKIPIIADSFVAMDFGTGMVKITPAHDPNDWEAGQRHGLEARNILNADGTLNEQVPTAYQGMTVQVARKIVVADLEAGGYLKKTDDHSHEVGHCYRCDTVIEPYLSEQWFVRMSGMAEKALDAWRKDEIHFYPKRWENTYTHWLEHIRDWCISRQLWWGHRIPVWYCQDCGSMHVLREDPETCPNCNSHHLEQDEDVLDTWFSSWLWPFSTLGWPEKTPDLARFFPTSTLVSGYDIIFFWVSRMIMASLEFLGTVPFRDIYMTGLVRDRNGKKMSKSLGNGIDPLDVIDVYGSDAMKFTMCYLSTQGQDLKIDMDSFSLGSRFANKIWNATRFILMNLDGTALINVADIALTTLDKWIYHELNEAAQKVKNAMEGYKFNDAAAAVYEFFWNDFCDWYVEASKQSLYSSDTKEKSRTVSILLDLLAESMRLMHPFASFVTEEIYDLLPNTQGLLISAAFPVWKTERNHETEAGYVKSLQEAVRSIRNLRSELQIPPERKIKVIIRPDKGFVAGLFFSEQAPLIANFVSAESLIIDLEHEHDIKDAIPVAGQGFESFVFIKDAIDISSEIARLDADIKKTRSLLEGVHAKLSNENFMAHAKTEAVEKEQSKKAEFEEKLAKGLKHLEVLKSFQ